MGLCSYYLFDYCCEECRSFSSMNPFEGASFLNKSRRLLQRMWVALDLSRVEGRAMAHPRRNPSFNSEPGAIPGEVHSGRRVCSAGDSFPRPELCRLDAPVSLARPPSGAISQEFPLDAGWLPLLSATSLIHVGEEAYVCIRRGKTRVPPAPVIRTGRHTPDHWRKPGAVVQLGSSLSQGYVLGRYRLPCLRVAYWRWMLFVELVSRCFRVRLNYPCSAVRVDGANGTST